MAQEQLLLPVCGPNTAQFAASQVARFAQLGGGQQVQAAFAPEGECARKRLVILSIDPDRAGPSTELVTTFFHEVFYAIQKSDPDVFTYSGDHADFSWIHEAGASYFGLETSATLAGIDSEVVWDAHMGFVRELLSRGEIDRQLSKPAIAERGRSLFAYWSHVASYHWRTFLKGHYFKDAMILIFFEPPILKQPERIGSTTLTSAGRSAFLKRL